MCISGFLNINVPIAGRLINETTYSKISSACILRGGASATSWLQSFVGEKRSFLSGQMSFISWMLLMDNSD